MSDDDNNNDDLDRGTPRFDCYWYSQGKCMLYEVPEIWVYQWLAKVPQAREDLLKCAGHGMCSQTDPDWVDFAESGITQMDAIEASDEWQSWANKFVDRHRQIKQNVFRTPKEEKDEE